MPPHPPATQPPPPVSKPMSKIGMGVPSGNRPGGPPTESVTPPAAVSKQIKSTIGMGIPGKM